jgi:hypothetical protein
MQRILRSCVVVFLMASPVTVLAHGSADLLVESTASGGGQLKVEYDFDTVGRLSFSASLGPVSLYTGIIPAFDMLAADEPEEGAFVLATGTQLTLTITAIDAGKTAMKIGTTSLAAAGDSVSLGTVPFPHTHPEYQLQLTLPEGEYGEGTISFMLTSSGPVTYAPSDVYTLKVSNGPLPLPDYDTTAYDSKNVKCLSKASKEGAKFASKTHDLLSACLDKVQVYEAKAALTTPPSNLAAVQAAAEKACADAAGTGSDSGTLLGKIAAAQASALKNIQKACGSAGSGLATDDDVNQHLGLVSCRAQEMVAAAYGLGRVQLAAFTARASQGGQTLDTYFPCLFLTGSD